MTIETASFISQLNPAYPEESANRLTADEHLRLIKSVVKASFPAITGPVTATPAELNLMVGNIEPVDSTLARLSATAYATFSKFVALNTAANAALVDVSTVANSKLTQLTVSVCLSATNYQTIITDLPSTMQRLHVHITGLTTNHGPTAYPGFIVLMESSEISPPLFAGVCAAITAVGPMDPGFNITSGARVIYGIPKTETATFVGSMELVREAPKLWQLEVNGATTSAVAAGAAVVLGHFANTDPGTSISVAQIAFIIDTPGVIFTGGLVRAWIE